MHNDLNDIKQKIIEDYEERKKKIDQECSDQCAKIEKAYKILSNLSTVEKTVPQVEKKIKHTYNLLSDIPVGKYHKLFDGSLSNTVEDFAKSKGKELFTLNDTCEFLKSKNIRFRKESVRTSLANLVKKGKVVKLKHNNNKEPITYRYTKN